MLTIVLSVLAGICGVGWLNRTVCCLALILYMQKKDTALSYEGMKACLVEAWLRTLHIKNDQNGS